MTGQEIPEFPLKSRNQGFVGLVFENYFENNFENTEYTKNVFSENSSLFYKFRVKMMLLNTSISNTYGNFKINFGCRLGEQLEIEGT